MMEKSWICKITNVIQLLERRRAHRSLLSGKNCVGLTVIITNQGDSKLHKISEQKHHY